jgi:hypothetical protein
VATDKAAARALRGDLDTIILKALRKRPEQRYETAAAFADDLERWLDGRPVRAQRSSGWYRARCFVARHRLVRGGTVTPPRAACRRRDALWQSWTASEDARAPIPCGPSCCRSSRRRDPAASRETRDADLTLLTTAESRLTAELATNPELALELRLAIAQAYRNRGEFERARATLRGAIDEARRTLPPDDLNLMRALVGIADWQLFAGHQVMRELDATIDRARLLGRRGAQILVEGLTARAGLRHRAAGGRAGGRARSIRGRRPPLRPRRPDRAWRGDPHVRGNSGSVSRCPVLEVVYRAAIANPDLDLAHPKRLELQSLYGILLCIDGRGREGLELLRASESIARKHHGGSLPTEYASRPFVGLAVTGDARGSLAAAKEALSLPLREPPGAFNRGMRIQHAAVFGNQGSSHRSSIASRA